MSSATFEGEKSIDELIARLFRLSAKDAKARSAQLAAALLKANPKLKDLSKVRRGSVLVIPDTGVPLALTQPVVTARHAFARAVSDAQRMVQSLAERLDAIDPLVRRSATSIGLLSQSRERPKVVGALGALSELVVAADAKALKARLKNLEKSRQSRANAFAAIQKHLGSLAKG